VTPGPLAPLAALALVPARAWLDSLDLLVPGPTATRWLLVADLLCLVALGATGRWRLLVIPVTLGFGFAVLNLLGMALNDFYLGLALFHLVVGATAGLMGGRLRWPGLGLVGLALLLGALT